MKKKNIISIIIILLIVLGFVLVKINTNTEKTAKYIDIENRIFSLSIAKEGEEIYKSENTDKIWVYNTLMLPMDIVLSQIFENYNQEVEEQTLTYNSTTLQIKQSDNIISVPNIYDIDTSKINDTVDVEIETINGTKYIPIYLIANIDGVQVEIDGKQMFDDNDYFSVVEAIDANDEQSIISIKIGESEETEEISSTEYIGAEQGTLWREEALKRIEKYRKSDTNIIVKNQNGNIIENASVNIIMNTNDFKFGTAIRMVEDTGINKYDGITRNLFNAIGSENGFKWSLLNQNGTDIPNDVIKYAEENDMYIRGHCLWLDRAWGDTSSLVGDLDNPVEGTMAYIYTQYNNGNITDKLGNEMVENLRLDFEEMVLNHIEEEVSEFSEVAEWDVTNEVIAKQYFKYYLYDKALLHDSKFATTIGKYVSNYTDNEQYYQFLAKCYDKAKEVSQSSKLVFNDDKINGDFNFSQITDTIRIISNIKKYTNNIDALGVQYHVRNNYQYTPQSYYNQINNVLQQTGIEEAVVTEYDNYISSKKNNYTEEEREEKANYLRDTLIACYSNQNISGFYFWVYNSGTGSFVEEEWEVYEELMEEWLNDKQSGTTNASGTYSTRAYNGEYTATVEINGLTVEKTFIVSPENSDIEIIINSNPKKLEVKQLPNKIQYIKEKENLDLTGGILEIYYDDGTTKEVSLVDKNVEVSSMDNAILGEQTIIVKYEGIETSFTVEVIEDQIGEISVSILQSYEEFEQNYSSEIQEIPNAVETIQNLKESVQVLQDKIAIDNSEELQQYTITTSNLAYMLVEKNIDDEKVYLIIDDTNKILSLYEQLNNLCIEKNSDISTEETITNITTFESKVIYYEDLNVSTIKNYIEQAKAYVENSENNPIYSITAKFLTDCSNTILDNYIEFYLEANPVTVNYSIQSLTNQDVIVNLTAGQDSTIKITNGTNESSYIISQNGQYVIEYTRRNILGTITATVNWIDKQAPIIEGIENDAVYTEPINITVSDENLENITLTKDGQTVEFTNGGTIKQEGEYKITATDRATNVTTYTFTYVDLAIPNYEIIDDKYIVNIEPNTTVGQFLENIKTDLNISIESQNVQLNENDKITTGTVIKIANNVTYMLVVTGDVTGDGNVDIADLVRLNMYSIRKVTLDGEYLLAGDVNHDGNVNIGDLVRLNLYSIGKINTL